MGVMNDGITSYCSEERERYKSIGMDLGATEGVRERICDGVSLRRSSAAIIVGADGVTTGAEEEEGIVVDVEERERDVNRWTSARKILMISSKGSERNLSMAASFLG